MTSSDRLISDPPKAFLTDVFGTVVNWRKTVEQHLEAKAREALNSPAKSIPSAVRLNVDKFTWPDFAQKWRKSYYNFTRSYDPDTMPFKTVDQHYLEALHQLIEDHSIGGLWSDDEVQEISLIWHKLEPWPDSAPGLGELSERFMTATLSNGNHRLLQDLSTHGQLSYTHIISAEDFKAYKPNPKVYLGAARTLPACAPSDCCLVAAHLGDLKAAKQCGYKTVYIERPQEEEWSTQQIRQAKEDAFVDMWIKMDENGFVTLANKFS